MARTLILCPTFDHADSLLASVASMRAQTDPDWEMVVVCDGSPPRTFEILEAMTRADPRITFVSHPKSPRLGEPYRDPVIRNSDCEFVLHLGDDDICSRDHVAFMVALLERSDWAHQASLSLAVDGGVTWDFAHIHALQAREAWSLRRPDARGLNNVGYRRSAYERLPVGWDTTPQGVPTDVAMWAKFLALPDLRIASSATATWMKLPSRAARAGMSATDRVVEGALLLARINEPGFLPSMVAQAQLGVPPLRAMLVSEVSVSDTFEAAAAQCGWRLCPPDTRHSGGVGPDPMSVGLWPAQRETLTFAFEVAKALRGAAIGEALIARARSDRALVGRCIFALSMGDWGECGRLIEMTDRIFDLPGVAHVGRLRLSHKQGDVSLMSAQLAEAERRWPDAKWLDGFRSQLRGLSNEPEVDQEGCMIG